LVTGVALAWRLRRSIVQVRVQLQDAAGQLNEVVGPTVLDDADDFGGLHNAAQRLAAPIRDLIERFHRSRQLAQRAEQLAAVGQVASGVAHEVRNPLTAIKILVQAAAERGEAGHLSGRHLRVLEEEVVRLERLTSSFLDFARPPQPEKREVDVGRMVTETLELLEGTARAKGVRFEPRQSGGSVTLDADPGLLRQLLFNLLANALEASPAGAAVFVEIGRRTADNGARTVELRVADTGPGLPAELGERIFEPFVSTKETGVGLGLSIARRVAEDHGGNLRGSNRLGGGAEFTAVLPAGREDTVGRVSDKGREQW
jgi:signal transduction histidine kinase